MAGESRTVIVYLYENVRRQTRKVGQHVGNNTHGFIISQTAERTWRAEKRTVVRWSAWISAANAVMLHGTRRTSVVVIVCCPLASTCLIYDYDKINWILGNVARYQLVSVLFTNCEMRMNHVLGHCLSKMSYNGKRQINQNWTNVKVLTEQYVA